MAEHSHSNPRFQARVQRPAVRRDERSGRARRATPAAPMPRERVGAVASPPPAAPEGRPHWNTTPLLDALVESFN